MLDPGHAIGWRSWAWAKLLKVWGSLRWSDLQAIIPAELALVEGRLVTTLRRTKTSGPNRRVRELPVAISEHAFFVKSSWLREGFNLLKEHASYKRDYLMPRLKSDGGLEPKPACYADATDRRPPVAYGPPPPGRPAACARKTVPIACGDDRWAAGDTGPAARAARLLDRTQREVCVPPQDKDLLGRWRAPMFTLGPSGDGSRGSRPSSRGLLGKPIATPG